MFTPDPYCPVQVRDSKGSHSRQSHGREAAVSVEQPVLAFPLLTYASHHSQLLCNCLVMAAYQSLHLVLGLQYPDLAWRNTPRPQTPLCLVLHFKYEHRESSVTEERCQHERKSDIEQESKPGISRHEEHRHSGSSRPTRQARTKEFIEGSGKEAVILRDQRHYIEKPFEIRKLMNSRSRNRVAEARSDGANVHLTVSKGLEEEDDFAQLSRLTKC